MKTTNAAVRDRATKLAEKCGCRTWKVHRGVAIWQLEEEGKIK
jgi:hypothetical protein